MRHVKLVLSFRDTVVQVDRIQRAAYDYYLYLKFRFAFSKCSHIAYQLTQSPCLVILPARVLLRRSRPQPRVSTGLGFQCCSATL